MFQTDLKIPDVLAGCRTSEEWKERRREILKIFAETEYGKRPDLDYKVFWRECVREEIEELNAVHIHSEITVETNLGRYTIPLAVFLPIREEKVPAAVLICSQHKEAVSMQVPPVMEGKACRS